MGIGYGRNMISLIVTRGLPGSGKTSMAREWVSQDRAKRARVNRDDIRFMLDEGAFQFGVTEARVLVVRNAVIISLLESGVSVICDDTNLPDRTIQDLRNLANQADAHFRIESFMSVPLQTCLIRNALRTDKKPIPEEAIRDMHDKYILN